MQDVLTVSYINYESKRKNILRRYRTLKLKIQINNMYTYSRFGGYEVSSKGDKRFSAFYAIMPDGRSIEQHYQCDIKGYDPGGINWRLGKGKPGLKPDVDLWKEYLNLWKIWAENNKDLIEELAYHADNNNFMLSDMFAITPINQARALSQILNERS